MRSAVVLALLTLAPVGLAEAHIHMTDPPSRATDAQGNPQKIRDCGSTLLTRDPAKVTTYLPGATITVKWAETIDHPGWFRIAFQPNGEVFSMPPEGAGAAKYPDVNQTGMTDATTGTMILKDMIADGTSETDVTLPNMECNNCTLQFIQVMTNNTPYDVFTAATNNDLYFNCADLTLAANAPDAGTQVTDEDAGTGSGGPNHGKETGGCSATGNAGGSWLSALAFSGVLIVRRRRRR